MQKGTFAGDAIRTLRKERGLTQEQLASAAGLLRTDVNAYENRRPLGARNAKRIADALSKHGQAVTPEDLGVTEDTAMMAVSAAQVSRIEQLLEETRQQLARIEEKLQELKTPDVPPTPARRKQATR